MTDAPIPPASIQPGQVNAETPQLQIDPNKVKAALISMGLAAIATSGGAATLLHFARERDLRAAVVWMQTSDFGVFVTGLTTLAAFAAIGLRAAQRKAREVYLAYHVRNRIAVVTRDIDPPKPA